ncbi:MAG: sulfite exporter TauE/SafE family protein [Lachnospiraceae bacterium]|nr:sulfite exporter TauE/SafE family protein [Lachnospiraceae bacterium]
MTYILFFIVCFGASIVGAICGIGGGVIIKPVLDSFGILSVTAISFLSGCTVLSMTTYSVIRNKLDKGAASSESADRTRLPLALGAAAGGLIGKEMFSYVKSLSDDPDRVGAVQAACLLVVTIGTLVYTIYKARINTHQVKNAAVCVLIGLFLGIMSSFLGIGGGPINLVVLFYFFSMTTKQAAEDSLYIIFFSQAASLISTIVTGSVPSVEIGLLLLMVAGGILGGVCGRHINKKIDEKTVDKLFIGLMVAMILINIYNIWKYM